MADFVAWLSPGAELDLPPSVVGFGPRIAISGEGEPLGAEDRAIVAHLFRDSSAVALDSLQGGYSPATVWRATSEDALGRRHAPAVVKLGPNRAIAQERVAFEKVEDVLGNNAPRVRDFVDLGTRAGIKFSYVGMGQGHVHTLQAMFAAGVSTPDLIDVVRATFDEILGRLYAGARYERLPLFEHYGFTAARAGEVRANVSALVSDSDEKELHFPGGLVLPNVCGFYEVFLAEGRLPPLDYHYVSSIHGDLNAANILVDAHRNVWVIDFFQAGPGHVLKDLAKFENDLLFLLTPIEDEAQLLEAIAITTTLRSVADLRAQLPERPQDVRSLHLVRAWEVLGELRRVAGGLCHEDRNPRQLQIALLRYAVHTLSFTAASELQKQWALITACSLAEQVTRRAQADVALRVDWIESGLVTPGRLGITLCPGRRDRSRDLGLDLASLRTDGVSRLLCLCTESELEWAEVPDLGARAQAAGLHYRSVPVAAHGTPEPGDAADSVRWCQEATHQGESVVVTSMAGLGRSGTLAACFLAGGGMAPDAAMNAVRATRGRRALETGAQEAFVRRFASPS